jgi:hypothetical protein
MHRKRRRRATGRPPPFPSGPERTPQVAGPVATASISFPASDEDRSPPVRTFAANKNEVSGTRPKPEPRSQDGMALNQESAVPDADGPLFPVTAAGNTGFALQRASDRPITNPTLHPL